MAHLADILRRYTISVEKLCLLWESLSKRAIKPMCDIETLSDQLFAATNICLDVPLCGQFPDLKAQLIYQIFMDLEKNLEIINCLIGEVEENTDSLSNLALQINRMRVCRDNVPPALSGSLILEYICDSTQYFKAQCATLKIALLSLNFRESLTIKNLRNAFFEPSDLKAHVQWCRQIGNNISSSIDGGVELRENLYETSTSSV